MLLLLSPLPPPVRNPAFTPDGGHCPEDGPEVDSVHLQPPGRPQQLPIIGRETGRARDAYPTDQQVELDVVCAICQNVAREDDVMVRLISRHTLQRRCWAAVWELKLQTRA